MGIFWSESEEAAEGGAGNTGGEMRRVDTAHQLQKLEPSLLSNLVLHRGYHDQRDVVTKRPLENTLKAFTLGWKMGVKHCECDITVTKDGKVILAHDETLERVASETLGEREKATIALSDLNYDQICQVPLKGGSLVPLLEDVLTSAIACGGLLVIELKSTGNWQRLVEHTVSLFVSKPYLFEGVGLFMSFNHLLMRRLKSKLKELDCKVPPCIGLTDTDLWPGFEDIIWSVAEEDCLKMADKFVADFNLDGLYVKYEDHFEEESHKKQLQKLLGRYIMGLWNAPDSVANLKYWADFGFRFVNTDLATHFIRTKSSNQLNQLTQRQQS